MKIVTDHGFPKPSLGGSDLGAFDAFKNERDYIAQNGRMKTTVAAMDWAAAEIEKLQIALQQIAREGVWPQIVEGADVGECFMKIAVEMRQTARAALNINPISSIAAPPPRNAVTDA